MATEAVPAIHRVALAWLAHILLGLYFYSDPKTRWLNAYCYLGLLVLSTGLLLVYAYKLSRSGRPIMGLLTGVLAAPTVVLLLLFLSMAG